MRSWDRSFRASMFLLCRDSLEARAIQAAHPSTEPCCTLLGIGPHLKFCGLQFFLQLLFPTFLEAFDTKTLQLFRDCCLYLGIMAATFGLADDEIDRLLAEAEARLAGAGSSDAVAVASASRAPATVAAPVAANAGDQIAAPEKKSEKLSVRVPQLAQKQKVRVFSLPSLSVHVFHDEDLSQIFNDAGNIPSWVSSWHHNDFL